MTKASKAARGIPARGDLDPKQGGHLAWPDAYVFVAGEVLLDLSFPAAAARLATLGLPRRAL